MVRDLTAYGNHRRYRFAVDVALTAAHHAEWRNERGQLAFLEKERWVLGMAAMRLRDRKRLVDERAALRDGVDNRWHQGSVKIVEDDDGVVAAMSQGTFRSAAFEIEDLGRHARDAGQFGEPRRIAIDRVNVPASAGEKSRVAAAATGDVEHAPASDEIEVVNEPRGRRHQRTGAPRHTDAP